MVETTAHLIRDHIASGGRLTARQKEIIAELKKKKAWTRLKLSARWRSSLPASGSWRISGWQS
jgi:hypothetical protein